MWKQINLKITDLYLDTPICNNHVFPPGLQDNIFFQWKHMGIVTIDLYREGTCSSFEQLKQYCALVFFCYLQVRDFVRKHISDFDVFNLNPTIVNVHAGASVTVSIFSKLLVEKVDNNTLLIFMKTFGLRNVHTCSVNARHSLIQFKVIHRLRYSKLKLHQIYPTISPLCNKCETLEGTLFHSSLCYIWKNGDLY